MSQSGDAEIIQAKITTARRDAEALKDKIKRRKDDLTDATRECPVTDLWRSQPSCRPFLLPDIRRFKKLMDVPIQSAASPRVIPTPCPK